MKPDLDGLRVGPEPETGVFRSLLRRFQAGPSRVTTVISDNRPRPDDVRVAPPMSAGEAFTPSQPKAGRRQVVGREAECTRILQALQEDRSNVVLYSERGRGKTSLSNMVVESLRRSNVIVARHTCEAGSTFTSILRGLMADLPASLLLAPRRSEPGEGCEAALPDRELRPNDMLSLPDSLACRSLVCLIDEFDRVEDHDTRTLLADSIKQLSDRDVDFRFLIVGVSEDLDQILGQHPSIQRSVLGIHLPLFTDQDVAKLISKGGRESGFEFPPPIIARVAALARGMPYIAQLLGLRLLQAARARGAGSVSEDDFRSAIERLLADANPRVLDTHAILTQRGTDLEMMQSLRRVATAPQDPWGRLHVEASSDGGASVAGRQIAPGAWSRLVSASVLHAVDRDAGLYVFANRALMHHVLLLAAEEALNHAREGRPVRPRVADAARAPLFASRS